jgi:thiamine biosynthesis lipoprotein
MRSSSFSALGTTASVVVTADAALAQAVATLRSHLESLDELCSRFRADSELSRVNARAGRTVPISRRFAEPLAVALNALESTGGIVDPTLGAELRRAGYDRTFELVRSRGTWAVAARDGRGARRSHVQLDTERLTVRVPAGVELDLGATAKAWAADRAARAIAAATHSGVLVSLGGDVAVAGAPPAAGWPIRIADDHAAELNSAGPVVAIDAGGLATSSTSVRRWRTDGGVAHHLLDPRTGAPAATIWRTVSVAARTCVDANVAATAAVVLSGAAPGWLEERALPARLVRNDGTEVHTSGWPVDQAAA